MDKKDYERAIAITKRHRLDRSLKDVMSVAEDAWAANKLAYRLIDLQDDEFGGEEALIDLDAYLDSWITELEILAHATQKIAKRADKTLRSRGDYVDLEEDGTGLSPDEEGDETVTGTSSGRPRHPGGS